jgi:hypothetical protein
VDYVQPAGKPLLLFSSLGNATELAVFGERMAAF